MVKISRDKRLPSKTTKQNSVELIYNLVKDSIETQRIQKSTLESKASTIMAFAAGIFALLAGAIDVVLSLPSFNQTLILISIFCLSLSIILATFVAWVRRYRIDPSPEQLAEFYIDEAENKTRKQIIVNWISAWKSNGKLIERNANILRLAFLMQVLGFILLGTVLFLSIL